MTNLRITPGDRLDVEMVRELRKCDAKFVIFGIAMLYMYVHLNHRILKLEDKLHKHEKGTTTFEDYERMKEQTKED